MVRKSISQRIWTRWYLFFNIFINLLYSITTTDIILATYRKNWEEIIEQEKNMEPKLVSHMHKSLATLTDTSRITKPVILDNDPYPIEELAKYVVFKLEDYSLIFR